MGYLGRWWSRQLPSRSSAKTIRRNQSKENWRDQEATPRCEASRHSNQRDRGERQEICSKILGQGSALPVQQFQAIWRINEYARGQGVEHPRFVQATHSKRCPYQSRRDHQATKVQEGYTLVDNRETCAASSKQTCKQKRRQVLIIISPKPLNIYQITQTFLFN